MLAIMVAATAAAGCVQQRSEPARATRAYPLALHVAPVEGAMSAQAAPRVSDIQVFRNGADIEIVNSLPRTFRDVDVWVNQQYVRHVDEIPAGATVRLSLREFYDELGEPFNAGGFFRRIEPTPVVMVEIQTSDDEPLLGLIAVSEDP